jgi:hypothetical protein
MATLNWSPDCAPTICFVRLGTLPILFSLIRMSGSVTPSSKIKLLLRQILITPSYDCGLVWKSYCVGHEALYFPIQAHRLINPQWPELGSVGAAVTAFVMLEDYNTKLLGKRMHDVDICTPVVRT